MSQEEKRVCLNTNVWAGFMRANDGTWDFADTVHNEDPATAARVLCSERWTSGTHAVLVCGVESAHEFRITVETEQVTDGGT